MPQLGESIVEGKIVRWNKSIGDRVERDEPLFEVSTDKVDAEIPSPVRGVVTEIRVEVGETVEVDSVVVLLQPTAINRLQLKRPLTRHQYPYRAHLQGEPRHHRLAKLEQVYFPRLFANWLKNTVWS